VECVAGVCEVSAACLVGRAQCPGDTGCDTRIDTAERCGGCTVSCSGATPFCSRDQSTLQYRCVGACDGATPTVCGDECVDTLSDPRHCGGCDACSTAYCVMGECRDCPAHNQRCNGVCMAENPTACGPSCTVCPSPAGSTPYCVDGVCDFTCPPGADKLADRCEVIWQNEALPGFVQLVAVWGSSANDVYAVGENGVIFHSPGDGTWTQQTSGTTKRLVAIWGSSATDVWVLASADPGANAELLHSTGNGTWSHHSQPGTSPAVISLWGASASDLYVASGNVYRNNGGTTWTPIPSVYAWYLYGFSATNVYFVSPSAIFRWNGATAVEEAKSFANNFASLGCVFGSSASNIWVGGNKFVYHSSGIDDWTQEAIPIWVFGLWGTGPNDMYAVGFSGAEHRDGNGWHPISGLTGSYRAAWGTSASNVYIVGNEIWHKIK
jgi:hypothetical protein